MNQKKAKALRRNLKSNGIDFREAEYRVTMHKGVDIGTVSLVAGCGRALYQNAKRASL